jgi:hypothetical protein
MVEIHKLPDSRFALNQSVGGKNAKMLGIAHSRVGVSPQTERGSIHGKVFDMEGILTRVR